MEAFRSRSSIGFELLLPLGRGFTSAPSHEFRNRFDPPALSSVAVDALCLTTKAAIAAPTTRPMQRANGQIIVGFWCHAMSLTAPPLSLQPSALGALVHNWLGEILQSCVQKIQSCHCIAPWGTWNRIHLPSRSQQKSFPGATDTSSPEPCNR